MTDTPELVTLKPLPIPPGHTEGENPVDLGTHNPETGQAYQEANHLQRSRTRFTYCLIPGVNCPSDATQRRGQWGTGPMNSAAVEVEAAEMAEQADQDSDTGATDQDEHDAAGESIDANRSEERSHSSSNSFDRDPKSAPGGASNEYGTVLGTGITPKEAREGANRTDDRVNPSKTASLPSDGNDPDGSTSNHGTDDDLTDDERRFLRTVVKALNGELEGYDFTQSMTTIRNTSGSQIDIPKLEDREYLEVQRVRGRKYYYVTPDGQTVVDRTLNRGRNVGDPYEKPRHKVYVEYLKRYIERGPFIAEKYFEPMGGGIIYDVAAFSEKPDGTRTLQAVGEVVTNIPPKLVVKHYDDMARNDDILKLWVVQNSDAAHEIVRVLNEADRVDEVPYKSVRNYDIISRQAFGEGTKWRILGATNLIDTVEKLSSEEDP